MPTHKQGSTGPEVSAIQARLKELGMYGGKIDGNYGPITMRAVMAFQYDQSLDHDGIVGPLTWAKLFPAEVKPTQKSDFEIPPWYSIAEKEIGQKERRGGENPRIIEYHKSTTLKATEDEVPWCASFVSWCLEQAGVKSARSARAADYKTWGRGLSVPRIGCIVYMPRSGGSGHVGFFAGKTFTGIAVLGGNQSDQVKISYFSGLPFTYRWPEGYPL